MTETQIGGALSLATALCWTLSSLSFESASKRAGSVPVNLIRLFIAFGMLAVIGWVSRGLALPTDATAHHWKWLLISGFVGFFVGDITLFRAFVVLGTRLTLLFVTLSPAFTVLAELVLLGRVPGLMSLVGIAVTVFGVAWVVLERKPRARGLFHVTPKGIALAVIGAMGQGVGLVFTKIGIDGEHAYDPFATTQVRIVAGVVVFTLFVIFTGRTKDTIRACTDGPAMGFMTLGALFGPVVGVSFLNIAITKIQPSVAQTLSGLSPVLIIPIAVLFFGEKVTLRATAGALAACAGVAMLTLLR
jgi:drug/metabolite transporter (DMT)-like permease